VGGHSLHRHTDLLRRDGKLRERGMVEALTILATGAVLFIGLPAYLTRSLSDKEQPDAGPQLGD